MRYTGHDRFGFFDLRDEMARDKLCKSNALRFLNLLVAHPISNNFVSGSPKQYDISILKPSVRNSFEINLKKHFS